MCVNSMYVKHDSFTMLDNGLIVIIIIITVLDFIKKENAFPQAV